MEFTSKLEAVEIKIEAEQQKKKNLEKKSARDGGLSTDDQIELKWCEDILVELKTSKKYWADLIRIQTKGDAEPESKSFKEADDEWTSSVTGVDTAYRLWKPPFAPVIPSDMFRSRFEKAVRMFHMKNEAGRRIILNEFLMDIVDNEDFNDSLKIYPELPLEVIATFGTKKRKLGGQVDYTVGYKKKNANIFSKAPPKELHLAAVEAKVDLSENDYWQCVAETAALYKSRKDAGKENCNVWGVLSNATDWQFIFIDKNGLLWRSARLNLSLHEYQEEEVSRVYGFLFYVVKCCFGACTPTASAQSLNE
ncbi:hypothetical protein BDR26DRAFT_857784 [Obelidium mucronatum]|nr:hypothetical protein BDR26DRAFT_857784 [Obelidium mucronatum]